MQNSCRINCTKQLINRVSHAKGKNDIIHWSYASMQCHIGVGTSSTRKQELRDYIDPFESLGMKLTSRAKFEDRNVYFAFNLDTTHPLYICCILVVRWILENLWLATFQKKRGSLIGLLWSTTRCMYTSILRVYHVSTTQHSICIFYADTTS
jgi:hypothetical protein